MEISRNLHSFTGIRSVEGDCASEKLAKCEMNFAFRTSHGEAPIPGDNGEPQDRGEDCSSWHDRPSTRMVQTRTQYRQQPVQGNNVGNRSADGPHPPEELTSGMMQDTPAAARRDLMLRDAQWKSMNTEKKSTRSNDNTLEPTTNKKAKKTLFDTPVGTGSSSSRRNPGWGESALETNHEGGGRMTGNHRDGNRTEREHRERNESHLQHGTQLVGQMIREP